MRLLLNSFVSNQPSTEMVNDLNVWHGSEVRIFKAD